MANHHIVKILGLYDYQISGRRVANGYFMEFMPGGSVREAITNTNISSCPLKPYLWIAQTAEALLFLHERHVYHGDVKPDNLLLSTDWSFLKLADFGTSTKVPSIIDIDFNIAAGTALYMSPELLEGVYPETREELLKSDNYSLAITIWEIFHRERPYDGKQINLLRVLKGCRPEIDKTKMYGEMTAVCESLWKQIPKERGSLCDVIDVCKSTYKA